MLLDSSTIPSNFSFAFAASHFQFKLLSSTSSSFNSTFSSIGLARFSAVSLIFFRNFYWSFVNSSIQELSIWAFKIYRFIIRISSLYNFIVFSKLSYDKVKVVFLLLSYISFSKNSALNSSNFSSSFEILSYALTNSCFIAWHLTRVSCTFSMFFCYSFIS